MRKLEKKMLALIPVAAAETKNVCFNISPNTQVFNKPGRAVCVRLYDTIIWLKDIATGQIYFTDGGWRTATTQSRLNALGCSYSRAKKAINKDCLAYQSVVNIFAGI